MLKRMLNVKFGLSVVLLSLLAACGGGGGDAGTQQRANTNPTTNLPTIVPLSNVNGTIVKPDSLVSVLVRDSSGNPAQRVLVNFEDTSNLLIFPQNTGGNTSVLTDDTGIAKIYVSPKGLNVEGAGSLKVTGSIGTEKVEGIVNYKTVNASSGVPDQDSITFGLAPGSNQNIEGFEFNDAETTLEVILGDHDNQKVNGATVFFLASGGSIPSSCTTIDGKCTVKFTSTAPKPVNGNVTVLAYALGEETFIDKNGNKLADSPVLPAGEFEDLGEPFIDVATNKNNAYDLGDQFIDTNNNGKYDGPDGKFAGALCDEQKGSAVGTCATSGTRFHVRKTIDLVLSKSRSNQGVTLKINGNESILTHTLIDQDNSPSGRGCSANDTFLIDLGDDTNNPMAAGTTISLKTDNGKLSTNQFTVGNSAIAGEGFTRFRFNLTSDGTRRSAINNGITTTFCDDVTPTGTLTITVTTPRNIKTFEKNIAIAN